MTAAFEVCAGSVTGRAHIANGFPNQDSHCVLRATDYTIAVVTDGCSDGAQSSVGAALGARIVAHQMAKHVETMNVSDRADDHVWWLDSVHARLLIALEDVLIAMGGVRSDPKLRHALVTDYLLFTVVAAIITPRVFLAAGIGDGRVVVNGDDIPLGKFDGNMPPYPAYLLTSTSLPRDQMHFRVLACRVPEEVDSFLIGTDGTDDLVKHADRPIPSALPYPPNVGPLSQFWTGDVMFSNRDRARRTLAVINGGVGVCARPGGLLSDDTTLVAGRRARVRVPVVTP